jgi:hypothetical protein
MIHRYTQRGISASELIGVQEASEAPLGSREIGLCANSLR